MTKIALLQLTSSKRPSENGAEIATAITEAASKGTKILFTPETSHLMAHNRAEVLARAKTQQDDDVLKALCDAARAAGIWLVLGSLIVKKDGLDGKLDGKDEFDGGQARLANRQFVINSDGEIVSTYDKIHLFDVDLGEGERYRESSLYDSGSTAILTDTPAGKLGSAICFDLRFPSLFKALAMGGADLITVPAAFTVPTGEAHWHSLLRARAIETGAYIIAPAQNGQHQSGRSTYGHSLIIDPWGEILVDAGDVNGIYYATIDSQKVREVRRKMPSLRLEKAFKLAE